MTNPTSNYNFQMPTATDLVTDLPADFEVFGQAVDTRLKALQPGTTLGDLAYSSATANTNTRLGIGTNGQVLGVVGGVPAWTTDAAGMTNPMTTTGDTIYSSSGSTPARLGIGSTGNVLTVSGGVPVWAAPAGGGKVLQVVQATTTTETVISSLTYTDSTLSATITPSSASSRILVMASGSIRSRRTASSFTVAAKTRILRDATVAQERVNIQSLEVDTTTTEDSVMVNAPFNFIYVDSPATTSATTYKIQGALGSGPSGTLTFQYDSSAAAIILMEIGA